MFSMHYYWTKVHARRGSRQPKLSLHLINQAGPSALWVTEDVKKEEDDLEPQFN